MTIHARADRFAEMRVRQGHAGAAHLELACGGRKGDLPTYRVLVCVLNTAAKRLPEMAAAAQPLMLVVDEAHRAGARTFSKVLATPAQFRLGLSPRGSMLVPKARAQGFTDELAKYPAFNYLGTQFTDNEQAQAATIVSTTASSNDNLVGVYTMATNNTEGAVTGQLPRTRARTLRRWRETRWRRRRTWSESAPGSALPPRSSARH